MPTTPLSPDEMPATPEARAEFIKNALAQKDWERLRTLFKAELLALPMFGAYMQPYNPRGFDSFADTYASYKVTIYRRGPHGLKRQEEQFLQFRQAAAERLYHIQQKKLFDLQCQWRAGQLDLPHIRHSRDFHTWSTYIDHCAWLPAITADEVAQYEAYLRGDTFDFDDDRNSWQDYEDFKLSEDPDRQEEADAELPGWYAYHNVRTGAGALLSLPDVRGAAENRYLTLWRAENQAEREERKATEPETEKLPWPPSCIGLDKIAPFLDVFEAPDELPRLQRWRKAAYWLENQSSWELEQAERWYVLVLHALGEAWPIKAHADWRVALREAGIDYWRAHVADALREVWQEQEQNRVLGLPLAAPVSYDRKPFRSLSENDENDWYGNAILRGRELAGEPRDFNF